MKKTLLFVILISFVYSFQTGSVVFRKENNILSDLFAQIDPCGYSHVGMIIIKNKKPFVIHIEYDEKKDLQIVPLKEFLKNASSYKILNPDIKINISVLKKTIKKLFKKNIKFDTDIKLDNQKLYCTELVDFLFYKASGRHLYSYLYSFKNRKIITVKSILTSRYLN
jgi:hypothetical protein